MEILENIYEIKKSSNKEIYYICSDSEKTQTQTKVR